MKPFNNLQNNRERKIALNFIILLGIVSLFGDITYEGARSVTGPFLLTLGASAAAVGLIAGTGEFIGYALRLVSGFLADKTRAYWIFVFIGYGLILSIPLLALSNLWQIAAIFIIMERMGKAIRTPARDTILSHATKKVGRGWGFGIHEALDQVGALIGPLIFSSVFFLKAGFREGFTILWIPSILTIFVLAIARKKVPYPEQLEISPKQLKQNKKRENLPRVFWFYSLFIFFAVAGFINFPLISYHFKAHSIFQTSFIPLIYSLAMGIDALTALVIGKIYDKSGLISLIVVPLLTICILPFVFSKNLIFPLIAILLWGMVMGIHETIMRAALADLVPVKQRGFAYGIFNTIYGLSWLLGGIIMGMFYDISLTFLILFALIMEIISFPLFFLLKREIGK